MIARLLAMSLRTAGLLARPLLRLAR